VRFRPSRIPGLGTAGGFTRIVTRPDQRVVFQTKLRRLWTKLVLLARRGGKRPELPPVTNTVSQRWGLSPCDVISRGPSDQDCGVQKPDCSSGKLSDPSGKFGWCLRPTQFNRFGRQWRLSSSGKRPLPHQHRLRLTVYLRNSGAMTPFTALVTVERVSGPELPTAFNLSGVVVFR